MSTKTQTVLENLRLILDEMQANPPVQKTEPTPIKKKRKPDQPKKEPSRKRQRRSLKTKQFTLLRPTTDGDGDIEDTNGVQYVVYLEEGKPVILNNAAPLQAAMKAVTRTGLAEFALRSILPKTGRIRYQFYRDGRRFDVASKEREYEQNKDFYSKVRVSKKSYAKKWLSKTKPASSLNKKKAPAASLRVPHLPERLDDFEVVVE